jgi:phosphomannomutase
LQEKYADADRIDFTDGITIEYADWHFNVRPSSNDPVIRLNLEADSQEKMEQKRDEVLAIIRGE